MARQPVYDRRLQVIAYELLYRTSEHNVAGHIADPDGASSQVIVNAFMEMGMETITGGIPALINVTREFLVSGSFPKQFSGRLIPELLEDIEVDDALVAAVLALSDKGYRIALDDFVYSESWKPILAVADIIKLDVAQLGEKGVREQLALISGSKGKLLAEKIESHEEYELYHGMGFDLFQGYFLAKPKVIKNKAVPASKMVVLNLLQELCSTEVEIDKVEYLICQDARLTYKLLRIVNSAFFGLPRQVDSIQEGVVLLGLDELKCWASILALAAMDDKPHALLLTAMVRARMCQELSARLLLDEPSMFFTAGLFSLLDALMDMPHEEIFEELPFSEEIVSAVLKHEGQIGLVLHTVIAYESGSWSEVHLGSLGQEDIWNAYLHAIEWADIASHSMYK